MSQTTEVLLTIGSLLLLGLATDFLSKRMFLPRVTLLLLFGVVLGDEGLGVIPASIRDQFDLIAEIALMMIGFLLGGRLTLDSLRKTGRQVAWISLTASIGTTLVVASLLGIAGAPLETAIMLGCVAAATAPAATVAIVIESGSSSRFSEILLAIVAVDDAWALVLFSLGLALTSLFNGAPGVVAALQQPIHEIGGALSLGLVLGLPAGYLTGRIQPGQPMMLEALGLVLVCGALAVWLDVSLLIAVMTMGAVIANIAKHHEYPFHEIENIEWPFMVVFFVVAGATLEFRLLTELGFVGAVYALARGAGKISGAWVGGWISGADRPVRRWMGLALMPQAGVAIGMSLLAISRFPDVGQSILTVVIATTVIFELIGPVLTRIALKWADDAEHRARSKSS